VSLSLTWLCQSCGATTEMPLTVHSDRETCTISVWLDPDGIAWLRLFAAAHTGPLTPARR
jgi:hypothetical protein